MSLLFNEVDSRLNLSSNQLGLLKELKQWVETEADFYGRSDKDFLIMFLYSCNFDMELSKKTLQLYYKVRVKSPKWWTNRDINQPQVQFFIKESLATTLIDPLGGDCPAVVVIRMSRFGPDPSMLDSAFMYATCGMDVLARRINCQLNGCVFIFDCNNYHWWLLWKLCWLHFVREVLNALLLCLPIKVNAVVFINAPALASTAISMLRSILPEVYRNKVQCCKRWSDIGQFVPLEALPDEYGGHAGPVKVHDGYYANYLRYSVLKRLKSYDLLLDATVNELLAMSNFFIDDNKYGYQT